MLYSRSSLVIYFIHSSVYIPIPISQFIPSSPNMAFIQAQEEPQKTKALSSESGVLGPSRAGPRVAPDLSSSCGKEQQDFAGFASKLERLGNQCV